MSRISFAFLILLAGIVGCSNNARTITFPAQPLTHTAEADWYDMNHDGKPDFGLIRDATGRITTLEYDDDEDGKPDRVYHLADYASEDVPHLVIMLDSVPYHSMAERYAGGEFRWFDPPQKVIAPFPTITEQIFSRILDAPPLPGFIDDNYDVNAHKYHHGILDRTFGHHDPWEFRCNYISKYYEEGFAYLDPRPWYAIELDRAKKAFDDSPDRVTLVYFVSASCMICKYGSEGCDQVLDGIQRFCLQVLYERQGAVKISMFADHGHNFMLSKNILFDDDLKRAGFHVTDSIKKPNDVCIDRDGLVTYLGIHTPRPQQVTDVVLKRPEVELAAYLQQDRVIVRDHSGAASIEYRNGKYRYTPINADVLDYQPILDRLRAAGKVDADGFVADQDWFDATVDAQFPDAPHRLWAAFHGECVSVPDVMLTLRDGYCSGDVSLPHFITMRSSHGGLNQINTATFLMTMTGRANKPLRSKDIMPTIEPGYVIPVRPR